MNINNIGKKEYKKIVSNLNTTQEIKSRLNFYFPISEEEFLQIKDIDQDWINKNYGKFLEKENRIPKMNKILNDDVELNSKTKNVLTTFSKKLASYSQQSKMVWTKGESIKNNIDLFNLDTKSFQSINEIINNPKNDKSFSLKFKNSKLEFELGSKVLSQLKKYEEMLETSDVSSSVIKMKKNENKKILFENANYDFFSDIIRTDIEIRKESGQEQLYIASYYLEGSFKLGENDIALRAPIFLFPVKIEKNERTQDIKLNSDLSRDVIVNNFIVQNILKIKKFEYDLKKPIEDNITKFLGDLKYKIDTNLKRFDSLDLESVKGELGFRVNKYLVLGLFKRFDSSIQEEIESILKEKKVNPIISETFSEYDIYDKRQIKKFDKQIDENINNDEDIYYIDKLNYQQVVALKKINLKDLNHLTIWGPPGTGKSQTILSIIIDALIKGQKIAVIAEKKVALDVIYERLGNLKHFALMITDINKKSDFFRQLDESLTFIGEQSKNKREFKQIDYTQRLRNKLDNLDQIDFQKEYPEFDNKSILDVFSELQKYQLSESDMILFNKYKKDLYNFNSKVEYRDIIEIFKKINKNFTIPQLKEFMNLNKRYLNFNDSAEIIETKTKLLEDLSDALKLNLEHRDDLERINNLIFEYKKIKFLAFFKKAKMLKEIFKTSLLKTKKEVKKFNQEKELIRLMDEEKDINKEIDLINNEISNVKYNEKWINEYKTLNEMQLEWVNKIISFSNKSNLDEDKNKLVNKVMLNLLIEKLIIDGEIFKGYERKINNWENQIDTIDKIQEELAEYNSRLVFERTLEKFNETIEFNNRSKTILKSAQSKNQISIFSFMHYYGLEIKRAYPIWLMRPEILSNLFENGEKFDIILVDEASQLFVEQALPALQHSRKIVVLGDEKQLSPSSFFQNRSDDESDDEINYIENDDSLLDFAKTKFPSVMLKNHYRSNYSDLIGYSNVKFYNNNLIATNNNSSGGFDPITFIKVENGVFENSINKREAEQVIKVLQEISKDSKLKEKSLGIVTMNNPQKEFMEIMISKSQKSDLTLNKYIKKSNLFVKSIENVQGDERDIIIFSSTYGISSNGTLNYRFGPINNQGGENRINVAVTRSKDKMYVVSSMDPNELLIKVQGSKNPGPKVFAEFLNYALNPQEWLKINTPKLDTEKALNSEEFTKDIYEGLKIRIEELFKYELLINNNPSNYGIDYIVYDKKNDKNIMGIEVDVNAFKGESVARARDLSKMQYLQSRGWHVYRLWTLNWFQDQEKAIEGVIKEVNKMRKIK